MNLKHIFVALSGGPGPATWIVAFVVLVVSLMLLITLLVALFHPDVQRRRHAARILRELVNARRGTGAGR